MFVILFFLSFFPKENNPENRLLPVKGEKQEAALMAGKKLYETRCISCHTLKNPYLTTKAKWIKILPRMTRRAKLKEEEKELLSKYIFSLQLK